MKACTKCGETKALNCFGENSRSSSGRMPRCKACSSAAAAAYRRNNPEKVQAWRDKAALEKPDITRPTRQVAKQAREDARDYAYFFRIMTRAIYQVEVAEARAQHRAEYQKHRRAQNHDRIIAQERQYTQTNADKIRARRSAHYRENPEVYAARRRASAGYVAEFCRTRRANLTDSYVKETTVRLIDCQVAPENIPPSVLSVRRLIVETKRTLWSAQHGSH